jgi:hypothetical protein
MRQIAKTVIASANLTLSHITELCQSDPDGVIQIVMTTLVAATEFAKHDDKANQWVTQIIQLGLAQVVREYERVNPNSRN